MREQQSISLPVLFNTKENDSKNFTKVFITGVLAASIILVIVTMSVHQSKYKHSLHQIKLGNGEGAFPNNYNTTDSKPAFLAKIMKEPQEIEQRELQIPKIDRNNKCLQQFTVKGRQIFYNGPNQRWAQLVSYKPIPYHQTYSVRILSGFSAHNHLVLGITNHERISKQSSFFNQDTYAYYGENGCFWIEGKLLLKDEKGFKQKDIVDIDIQLWEGLIQWKVNGELREQMYSQNLKQKDKNFVFYFEMFEAGDFIKILNNQNQ